MLRKINDHHVGVVPSAIVKRLPIVSIALFGAAASLVVTRWSTYGAASLYGVAVFTILGTKLLLSLLPAKRWPAPNPRMRVGVIVTLYNEDPELLRQCLGSILNQTFQPTHIVIIDDHSRSLDGHDAAQEYAAWYDHISVIRQQSNLGKREALGEGFRALAGRVDVFLCVDSDSYLEPNAIYEGMRPFRSRKTAAATGIVLPSNYNKNIITRLQDVRYINSFLGERAAYSKFGSVLCVCGALAFYRANMVMRHLDDFLDQTFFGRPAVVGDDRHMTNRLLTEGRVVLVEGSISHTAVPEKLGHFVRQQARWGRSFFRESIWALRNLGPGRCAWWLTLMEMAQWAIFSTILVYVVLIHPIVTGQILALQYLIFVGLMAATRAVRYFDLRRRDQSIWSRLTSFSVAPLYGYLSLFVLLPLRFYSLFTLRMAAWGTRNKVEVHSAVTNESTHFSRPRGRYRGGKIGILEDAA
ncbi:glycosyltransferase [Phytoactinopolyspora halophila]|nr:glycosyltransferase [Phytoactinopolyspora halophila]